MGEIAEMSVHGDKYSRNVPSCVTYVTMTFKKTEHQEDPISLKSTIAHEPETEQHNWGVIGHEHVIDLLRRALAARRVGHAYLFTGPEHIGKILLAQRFAQALLCTNSLDRDIAPQNPCNTCLACRKVMHGNHPDLHLIARAHERQFILIEQVHALQSDSARKTLEGRHNIFL